MKISVIIPTLNAGPLFSEVLQALKAQKIDAQVELVIIDSGSEDGTAELGKKYADLFFEIPRAQFNHGETRNLAISQSQGELIALLVQDATPANPYWLKKLADNFSDPKVAGAYSRQIPRSDCNPLTRIRLRGWSSGKHEKRIQELNHLKIKEFKELKTRTDSQARPLSPAQIQELIATFSFDNVSSMVRRSAWEQVKFPVRRFAEDIAWCQEVLLLGWKVVYEPESVVIHSHNKSLWYEFKRVYLDHQNWWQVGKFRIFNRKRELLGATLKGSWKMLRELWKEREKSAIFFLGWGLYTPVYVLSQNLAQYLGSWADRWKEKYKWYNKIDQWLSKGV